jgi:hypothetical protein
VSDAEHSALITISMKIENRYGDGTVIPTSVADAVIPAPPDGADADALNDWAHTYLFSFTGTGRETGDSWYDVTVTASSDPTMVGTTYEFGY